MTTKEEFFGEFKGALVWFSGKSRQNAWLSLCRLAVAAERGFWLPEDKSRSIRATLNKSNLAVNFVKRTGLWGGSHDYKHPFYEGLFSMYFGQFDRVQSFDIEAAKKAEWASVGEGTRNAISIYTQVKLYRDSFAAISAALKRLDDTRPQPVFTSLGASPTVTTTLKSLGFDGAPGTTAAPCPVEWVKVELVDKKDRPYSTWEPRLLWPQGTRHNLSRYAAGSAHNDTCHACGHAIKNAFNWVPVLIQSGTDISKSMWVGSDCAKRIFGISISNKVEMRSERSGGGQ